MILNLFSQIAADLEKAENAYRALARCYEDLANCFICIECGRAGVDEDGCCFTCGRDCLHFEDGKLINTGISDYYDSLYESNMKLTERVRQLEAENSVHMADKFAEHRKALPDRAYDQLRSDYLKALMERDAANAELAELRQLEMKRGDVVRALLDGLSRPAGRLVRRWWDEACLLFGRHGEQLSLGAFVAYYEDLRPGAFMDHLLRAAHEMHAADPDDPKTKPGS